MLPEAAGTTECQTNCFSRLQVCATPAVPGRVTVPPGRAGGAGGPGSRPSVAATVVVAGLPSDTSRGTTNVVICAQPPFRTLPNCTVLVCRMFCRAF